MKIAIQNALRERASSGTFYAVSYDKETGLASRGDAVVPASVEVNDTTATWAEDSRNRRAFKSDRTSWKWDLHLSFHTEADLSEFERAWESGPLRVMIGSPGPAAALLTLSLGRYNHPPRGGSSNGTDVVYTVNCDLTQQ